MADAETAVTSWALAEEPAELPADLAWFDPVIEPLPASPGWVVAALELHRRHGDTTAVISGHGAGPLDGAIAAAVGELAERFIASDPRVHAALVQDKPGRGQVIQPPEAHPAASSMRPGWVLGVGTGTGAPLWLPAGAVLLGWQHDPPFVDATGLAAAATSEDAIARASGEVRERDAVGRWWRGSLGASPVEVPAHIAEALAADDLAARLLDVDETGAVVACVHGRRTGATVGSAWGGRLDHAVAEALMIRGTVLEHLRTGHRPAGLSDGLAWIAWGWDHADEVLVRFEARPRPSVSLGDDVEPIAVPLGRLDPTPLGPLVAVRVLIPGAYRLETLPASRHPHPVVAPEQVGTPHPFG